MSSNRKKTFFSPKSFKFGKKEYQYPPLSITTPISSNLITLSKKSIKKKSEKNY